MIANLNACSFGRVAIASLLAAGLATTVVPATLVASPLASEQQELTGSPLPSVSSRSLSGSTAGQPFVSNQTGNSQHYRIPSIITLDNGWLLAGADARWGVYSDSPENLDGLVSISKDGGKTWDWQLVNEFVDYPSQNGGHKGSSASFIDPTFIQGEDGTVYMMADAWPAGTGIWGTGGNKCESTGFDKDGNFLISRGKPGAIASLDDAEYTYFCDAAAKQSFIVNGDQVELTPIKGQDGSLTGSWIDAYYDLYTVEGDIASPVIVKQHESNKDIQANVFYSQSEWKAYPTCYIWLVKGTPSQDGIAWGAPSIVNVKRQDDQPFTGICPGRGLAIPLEDGRERIMFQIYESKQGAGESASAIWSDDAGATWQRGERANKFNGTGKSSESQTIRLPNGGVRMYSRNGVGAISYADSLDNGETWSEYAVDPELQYTGNCMVSFINVDGCLVDKDGRIWSNLVAASYPKTGGRRDGAVRVGSIDAASNKVTWLNRNDIKYNGRFLYSCLTQVEDDKLAIVYEQQEPKSDGTQDVIFDQFSLLDLLGDGWSYSATIPALNVSNRVETLDADEEIKLFASVEGADKVDYSWKLEGAQGDGDVARIEQKGAGATLIGVGAGRATVRLEARFDLQGKPVRLETSWDVFVSDDTATVLPDRLGSHAIDAAYEKPYLLAATLPARGACLIHGQADGGRIMYNLPGKSTPDRLRGTISGNEIAPDTSGKFPIANQTWMIERRNAGYTIASAADGRYLSIAEGQNGSLDLILGDSPGIFAIQGEDVSKTVATTVGGRTAFIGMDAKGAFVASESEPAALSFGLATAHNWTVSTNLIANVLDEANRIVDSEPYTQASWSAFADARDRAQGVLESCKESYDSEGAAMQQKDWLDAAAKELFRAQRSLEPKPKPDPKPDPNPDDGTVDVETDQDGNRVTTTTRPDGTSTVHVAAPDGVTVKVERDAKGNASSISCTVPSKAAQAGRVRLPIPGAQAHGDLHSAPMISITVENGDKPQLLASVPLSKENAKPGTVAFAVEDQREEPIQKTALGDGELLIPLRGSTVIKIVDNAQVFEDVIEEDWFAREVVAFSSARGIVHGVPGSHGTMRFQGNGTASRAMLVAMLSNLEAARPERGDNPFSDVNQDDWFAGAARWGNENGIVAGYGDGSRFGGNDAVTREQVAVFLMRYANMLGIDTSARAKAPHPDAHRTSDFAVDAVEWAVAENLIMGDESGMLNPTSAATRAEVAAILMRFINTQLYAR